MPAAKKSTAKTVAKKSQAKKPATKKAPAKAKAATPSKAPTPPKGSVGTYTPQPVTGIGWAPFRYPVS